MGSISDFRKEALRVHNDLRGLHGAASLRSAPDLDRSAQEWAEKLAKLDKLENSPLSKRGEVGESISLRSSGSSKHVSITGEEVCKQWYKDIEKYDYEKGLGQGGNFTQLVWVGTREVGLGRANADGKVIVVAHYRPPGNVRGKYNLNVRPPVSRAAAAEASGGARSANSTPELEGYRVRSRLVDKEERHENGEIFIVETETIEYEDNKGNTKQKVIERRHKKKDYRPSQANRSSDSSRDSSPENSRQTSKTKSSTEAKEGRKKDKNLKKFIKDTISFHNAKRSLHHAKPLKENKELSALAQNFAEELSQKDKLYNSSCTYRGDRLGENIASRWSNAETDYSGEQVVEHWYNEQSKYDFKKEPTDVKGIGNFTQLVWKNSKEIGVGKAIHITSDGSHKVVVVCYYYPSGNVLQCFKENVVNK